jgi:hypothetical protein
MLPDDRLGALSGAAQEALFEVPVLLLGCRDRGVAELSLHVDQWQTGGQPGRGGRVAQVVEAQTVSQPGIPRAALCQSLETVLRLSRRPPGRQNTGLE